MFFCFKKLLAHITYHTECYKAFLDSFANVPNRLLNNIFDSTGAYGFNCFVHVLHRLNSKILNIDATISQSQKSSEVKQQLQLGQFSSAPREISRPLINFLDVRCCAVECRLILLLQTLFYDPFVSNQKAYFVLNHFTVAITIYTDQTTISVSEPVDRQNNVFLALSLILFIFLRLNQKLQIESFCCS